MEFSRPIDLGEIEKMASNTKLLPRHRNARPLAQAFDILGLEDLRASLDIRKLDDGETVTVTGHMTAKVTQKCTVSLDPFEADMSVELARF